MPPKTKKIHAVGTMILCKHKNVAYEAKIIEIKEASSADPIYVVHYQGWHKRYDEEVRHSASETKFIEATKDTLVEAKIRRDTLEFERSSKKKRKQKNDDEEGRKSEYESRGSSPSEKTPSLASTKAKKRKATDSPAVGVEKSTSEVTISLPKPLMQILVDDYDLISKCYLYKTPAKFNIRKIVEEYINTLGLGDLEKAEETDVIVEYDAAQVGHTSAQLLHGTAKMIVTYFDYLLGYMLLYKFERPQLASIRDDAKSGPSSSKKKRGAAAASLPSDEDDDFEPSLYYGLPHLLRLLSRMTSVLRMGNISEVIINNIINCVHDFIVFLNKNHRRFHSEADYETAPPDYARAVHLS